MSSTNWESQQYTFVPSWESLQIRWRASISLLDKALSPSLEALQAGTEGTKLHFTGNFSGALKFYLQAVEIDPNLALVYEGMAAAE